MHSKLQDCLAPLINTINSANLLCRNSGNTSLSLFDNKIGEHGDKWADTFFPLLLPLPLFQPVLEMSPTCRHTLHDPSCPQTENHLGCLHYTFCKPSSCTSICITSVLNLSNVQQDIYHPLKTPLSK